MSNRLFAALAIAAAAASGLAQSPLSTAGPLPRKAAAVTTPSGPGAFLGGADDCGSPHVFAGTGDVSGVPFTTGTTGTTGQNEAPCLYFQTTGIDADVWYDWTAAETGLARLETCISSVDTKLAVYPQSVCPADGSALACNDDACFQSSAVAWSCTAGATYTFQIGTFPGAVGGSGIFDVEHLDPPLCGRQDDGSTENAIGLTQGGEFGWLVGWDVGPEACLRTFDVVHAAYGTFLFPGSVTNGSSSRIAVYRDLDEDGDPGTGLVLELQRSTVVTNGDTDLFNAIPLGACVPAPVSRRVWTLVTADHAPAEYPAPLDLTPPTYPSSGWYVGSNLGPGTLDLEDLGDNQFPPSSFAALGLQTNLLSRIDDFCDFLPPFETWCFGDGEGAPCGCGNEVPRGTASGCRNGTGVGGSLTASGTPSIASPDVTFTTAGQPATQPGLLFQGRSGVGIGGFGATFGDGIRCCGGGVVRLVVRVGNGSTTISSSAGLGLVAGESRCYQKWYRDPQGSPCGSNFNLTNAVFVTWVP